MFTENANQIFRKSIADYHRYDDVDRAIENPYAEGSIEHLLYMKNWIDTVQWHLEDIIRDPQIDPCEALKIKRRIDKSNQDRTDMVEYIDSWMLDKYRSVVPQPDARINTETPAWPQVHEDLQTDEDVQRPGAQSRVVCPVEIGNRPATCW